MTSGKPATILLVEDDLALQRVAMRALQGRLGYTVLIVVRAEDALALIERGEPVDLVLSDLRLYGMDGLELYQQLRIRGYAGKFILTSGSPREDVARERPIPPEVAFLPRPWKIDELTQAIWKALGEA